MFFYSISREIRNIAIVEKIIYNGYFTKSFLFQLSLLVSHGANKRDNNFQREFTKPNKIVQNRIILW